MLNHPYGHILMRVFAAALTGLAMSPITDSAIVMIATAR